MTRASFGIFRYFIFLILIGNIYIAITPPFEGFDELAHFSAVRQLTYSNYYVTNSDSFIDQALVDYSGPEPYTSGNPPFDNGNVYWKFFGENTEALEEFFIRYRETAFPQEFYFSDTQNYEYRQQPPLYYLLLSIIYPLIDKVDLFSQIFALRLFSYYMSLAGVLLGILAVVKIKRNSVNQSHTKLFGFYLYPVLFPMFFPQFARIGNDSLCLLLVGLLAYVINIWHQENFSRGYGLVIGLILGFGCLTKAFFLPISAGVFCYLITIIIFNQKKSDRLKIFNSLILVLGITILAGGWWYLRNYIEYGTITGANVAVSLSQTGGVWKNLSIIGDNFYIFIRGLVTIAVTFVWAGSFSLTHIPYFLYIPSLFLLVFAIYKFVRLEIGKNIRNPFWVLVWTLFFFLAGLTWHTVVNMIAGSGNGNTPGWYLHILAPFTAPAIGMALWNYYDRLKNSIFIKAVNYYYLLLIGLITALQIFLFTGILQKAADKSYSLRNGFDFQHLHTIVISRLEIIGYPNLALINFLILLILVILIKKKNV
jgi:hypothetical protein